MGQSILLLKYLLPSKRNFFVENARWKDWASGFRNRNQKLSLRKPENTKAARSFAFNKTAVVEFFDYFESVCYKFTRNTKKEKENENLNC